MKKKATSIPLLAFLSLILIIGLFVGIPTFALDSDAADDPEYLPHEEQEALEAQDEADERGELEEREELEKPEKLTSAFDNSYQLAFHLYTPHVAIIDRFGDNAAPNAQGIYVMYVPVVPGTPRNTWPNQELLTAALDIGHIFSEDGIPGHAFWGWFDNETLDASGRTHADFGLRRPALSDTCAIDQILLQIETLSQAQIVDLFGSNETLDVFAIWSRWGDVNDDDRICDIDLVMMADYVLNRPVVLNISAANVYYDGYVCDLDIILLTQYLLTAVPEFHLGRPSQNTGGSVALSEFRFNVEDTEARLGDEYVIVRVDMTEFADPGFSSFRFDIVYDSDILTLLTTRTVVSQAFIGYPDTKLYFPGLTDQPAFSGITNADVTVDLLNSSQWYFTTQTGRYFPRFDTNPIMASEEMTLRQIRRRMPREGLDSGFGGPGDVPNSRRAWIAPRMGQCIYAGPFYMELAFSISPNAQIGDYANIRIVPVTIINDLTRAPLLPQTPEETGYVRIVGDQSHQIAFHLYTPHAAIIDRFGGNAAPNAEGIYVMYVPVVPGTPRNTWPNQELLAAALDIGHIFSEYDTPGHAFWGWFDNETLDASGRTHADSGLRRPALSDTCVIDQILLQIETLSQAQIVDLFGSNETLDVFAIWSRWGDVNDDDRICDIDLVMMTDYILNRPVVLNISAANVYYDGYVCDLDIILLTRYLLTAVPEFHLGRPSQNTGGSVALAEFRFNVEDTEVKLGDEYVIVRVDMTEFADPGFSSFRFDIVYDSDILTLLTTHTVVSQAFIGYPDTKLYVPGFTDQPAFSGITNTDVTVDLWNSSRWYFTTQTGRYFPRFDTNPIMASEEITLRQVRRRMFEIGLDSGFGGPGDVPNSRRAWVRPRMERCYYVGPFYMKLAFSISPNAQIGDYANIRIVPITIINDLTRAPLLPQTPEETGYVRIVGEPAYQIAFHLYATDAAIIDKFGDHATPNADGIYVINVPVIPGKPYYEWPDQELVQAVLEICNIFSVDGIPGHAFWGWFTDETLDASGRIRKSTGLRRPFYSNICDWEYGVTRAQSGIFALLQYEHITALQWYELFGADGVLNLYGVWSLWGDVNDDGRFCFLDEDMLSRYLSNRIGSYDLNLRAANVNFDGVVCDQDRLLMMNYFVGAAQIYHLGRPSQIEDSPGFVPGEFRFNIDDVAASQGDEYVYVRINMTEFYGDGFSSLRFGVLYDNNLLTLDTSPRIIMSETFLGSPLILPPSMLDHPAHQGIVRTPVTVRIWNSSEWMITENRGRYITNLGGSLPLIASEEITLRAVSPNKDHDAQVHGAWGGIHTSGARIICFRRWIFATIADFHVTDFYVELRFRIADNAQIGDYTQISIVPIQILSNGRIRTFPEQIPEEMGLVTIVN